jgi:hypothetical protein
MIELKITVDPALIDALRLLAAAMYRPTESERMEAAQAAVVEEPAPVVAEAEAPVDNTAAMSLAVEKPKAGLDLVEVEKPAITRAELQAKAARLVQVGKGKYAIDLKGALEQCGAANISSLEESMFGTFDGLMADLWEVTE